MSEIKLRYSKQRETIYEVLKTDPSHPSVDTIYTKVKTLIPDISLGTVYRNLNLLAEQKRIARLDVGDGVIHFDACITPHYHMVCDECGSIQDIPLDKEILQELISNVNEQSHVQIHDVDVLFHGVCHDCCRKKS